MGEPEPSCSCPSPGPCAPTTTLKGPGFRPPAGSPALEPPQANTESCLLPPSSGRRGHQAEGAVSFRGHLLGLERKSGVPLLQAMKRGAWRTLEPAACSRTPGTPRVSCPKVTKAFLPGAKACHSALSAPSPAPGGSGTTRHSSWPQHGPQGCDDKLAGNFPPGNTSQFLHLEWAS